MLGTGIMPVRADQGSSFWTNPAYKDLFEEKLLQKGPGTRIPPEVTEFFSFEDFRDALAERLDYRMTQFTIRIAYNFLFDDVGAIINNAMDEILAQDDYLGLSIFQSAYGWNGFDQDVTINFTYTYNATYDQVQYVYQRVDEILAQIITQGMNDEAKEKAIHDWIVLNVQYDTSLVEHSAYAALSQGKTVCQGYTLLADRMLSEAGILTQTVIGTGNGVDHTWNLVYLCGNWYHFDATWDDPVPDVPGRVVYNFFNLSDSEMINNPDQHVWQQNDYPAAPISYIEGVCAGSPQQNIALSINWNLISLPLQPGDTSIETVLGSIVDKYESVWAYINGQWKSYDPNQPFFSDLTAMQTGIGYWIKMKEAAELTISGSGPSANTSLSDGWNLVGFKGSEVKDVETALASIAGKYVSVWAYINGQWKSYDPNQPFFSDLTNMTPGVGYWIKTSEACTWSLTD